MASCPVRAEQVLESHGRPLRTTLSRPSDCAKYEITLDVALHFGPEGHSCAEKLNKNNDQVGRETLQLFKSGMNGRSVTSKSARAIGLSNLMAAIMPVRRTPASFSPDRAPSLRARYITGAENTRVDGDPLELSRRQQAITNHLLLV